MPQKRAVIGQYRPAPPADLITLVITLPAELHAGTSVALARAAVHPPPDGDETELAGPVVAELDEAGRYQVDGLLIPHVHLCDPPPAIQVHHSFLLPPSSSPATSVALLPAPDRGGGNPHRARRTARCPVGLHAVMALQHPSRPRRRDRVHHRVRRGKTPQPPPAAPLSASWPNTRRDVSSPCTGPAAALSPHQRPVPLNPKGSPNTYAQSAELRL
jgi:hypothetical protein